MSSIPEKPRQQVLIPYDFSQVCDNAILHAVEMARIFRCEISLVHSVNKEISKLYKSGEDANSLVRSKLIIAAQQIIDQFQVPVNVYVFKGEIAAVISTFYERINAIIMVVGLNAGKREKFTYFTPSNIVRNFRSLRIPLLIVQNKKPTPKQYQNIVVPIDFNKESKEKSSWATYFSKLHQSTIFLVSRTYKDVFFSAQLRNNLLLIRKLFNGLDVTYEEIKEEHINVSIDRYAVSFAALKNAGLIIIMASREFGIDDYFLGPPEQRIIRNAEEIPILCLNPRDDLYVPCL